MGIEDRQFYLPSSIFERDPEGHFLDGQRAICYRVKELK